MKEGDKARFLLFFLSVLVPSCFTLMEKPGERAR